MRDCYEAINILLFRNFSMMGENTHDTMINKKES